MKQLLIILILFCSLQGFGQIKGYWRLNGISNDASGNGYNGTDTNVSYSQDNGILNQGAGFNGSSSYIDFGAKIMSIGAKTLAFYFKTSYTGNYQVLYDDCNTGAGDGSVIIINKTTGIIRFFSAKSGSARYDVGSNTSVCDGKWHFFVGTWDGTTSTAGAKLYIDGILRNTKTATSLETIQSTYNSFLGKRFPDNIYYFNGSLDEIIIDNTAWSPAKIKNEYSRIKGFF